MMPDKKESNKKIILGTLRDVERVGIEGLVDFLENKSDFFDAPASTKYHSSYQGGLAAHSLEVYNLLQYKNIAFDLGLSFDSVAITALLHDICKCNFYTKEMKSVLKGKKLVTKNKKENSGQWVQVEEMVNDWQDEEVYTVKDTYPIGHGEKSVIQVLKYIALTDKEVSMIRWHMGFTEPQELHRTLNNAVDLYPEIIALHTADLEASYYLESREVDTKNDTSND